MTWTKFGAEFSEQCAAAGLSDAAYRTHSEAIQWLYLTERGDCRIPRGQVRRIAASDDWERAVRELVAAGMWADAREFYVVEHHGDVVRQSLAAQQAKRSDTKERTRNWRARKAAGDASRDASRDAHTDSQTDIHRGEAPTEAESWPEVAPVGRWLGAEARARKTA